MKKKNWTRVFPLEGENVPILSEWASVSRNAWKMMYGGLRIFIIIFTRWFPIHKTYREN